LDDSGLLVLLDSVGGGNWGSDLGDDWGDDTESLVFSYGVGKVASNSLGVDDSRVMSWSPEDNRVGAGTGQESGENDGLHVE